jgi:hypothetical protein
MGSGFANNGDPIGSDSQCNRVYFSGNSYYRSGRALGFDWPYPSL